MGVKRFRFVSGAVLAIIATFAVARSHAGTVSASPDATTVEAPIDFEQPAPAQVFDETSNLANPETDGNAAAWTTVQARGDHSELLLLGDAYGTEPAAWSHGFADGSMSSGSSASRGGGGSGGSVFEPPPEQVLIPLPSAAWTGLSGLVALGLFGMMKHARRFLR